MYKTYRRSQLKIGSKTRWSHNLQTVLIALQCLYKIAMRTLYPSDDFLPVSPDT